MDEFEGNPTPSLAVFAFVSNSASAGMFFAVVNWEQGETNSAHPINTTGKLLCNASMPLSHISLELKSRPELAKS